MIDYILDGKTVGVFFLKIGLAQRKSLMREVREPYKPVGRVGERKKSVFLASLPGIALCFQLRSRPFV